MAKTHRRHVFHLRRFGLFGALIVAYFVVRFDAGALPKPPQINGSAKVLAYASEMSRGGLVSATNAARAANGLGGFTLDSQLNNAAQMKAEDMAAKNYWAHVSPDGTQPWYFFEQAGYTYVRAGENLAYGFSTSQATVDGWMNSTSHRANILGNYNDVGFGIVNVPDYQSSGQQTIVVAHYGSRPAAATPAPAPAAPVTPAPSTPQTQPQSVQPTTPAEANSPSAPEKQPEENSQAQEEPDAALTQAGEQDTPPAGLEGAPTPVQTAQSSQVSVLSMMATRHAPAGALFSLVLVSLTVLGYALTHRSAFQHAVTNGEHFVVAHPGVDTGIIAAVTTLILLTTYGNVG
jgi:cell division septation protein DedD